jgi:hypothetical protein
LGGFFGTTQATENGYEIIIQNIIRILQRAESLKKVSREMAKYHLDQVAVRKSYGMRMAVSQQTIICFPMEMGMLIITQGQAFSCIREPDQQIRGQNLFMTRCRIQN